MTTKTQITELQATVKQLQDTVRGLKDSLIGVMSLTHGSTKHAQDMLDLYMKRNTAEAIAQREAEAKAKAEREAYEQAVNEFHEQLRATYWSLTFMDEAKRKATITDYWSNCIEGSDLLEGSSQPNYEHVEPTEAQLTDRRAELEASLERISVQQELYTIESCKQQLKGLKSREDKATDKYIIETQNRTDISEIERQQMISKARSGRFGWATREEGRHERALASAELKLRVREKAEAELKLVKQRLGKLLLAA